MKLLEVILALDICVFITFVVFKVLGIIAWAMVWVLAPLWIPAIIIIIFIAVLNFIVEDIS